MVFFPGFVPVGLLHDGEQPGMTGIAQTAVTHGPARSECKDHDSGISCGKRPDSFRGYMKASQMWYMITPGWAVSGFLMRSCGFSIVTDVYGPTLYVSQTLEPTIA